MRFCDSGVGMFLLNLVTGLVLLAFAGDAVGQQAGGEDTVSKPATVTKPTQHWPDGVDFDESIPTPKSHFGFDIGHRHLDHAQVASYVRALAAASNRISIQQYATTHGGRPLLLLTITSTQNRNRLDEIQDLHRRLTKVDAANIAPAEIASLPAIINMGYGVHGDEPSATNCAPLIAYYLAAAQGDEVEKWLDDCVILLDPSLNPDGFNRFANWANRYRGSTPNPDPTHAEHNQMWPPGRVNYYWFDLNRDWLPLVHPESQGRMTWYHDWKPNVVLDFHEMGTNSTYFFQPGIPERTNPMTPAKNQELTRQFASYHSKALDQRGSLYFTQERFDDFYMGKGSTYPDLHGCVGILFEQAGSRGQVQKYQDGVLKFSETIGNQFTTSLSSLRATSAMRKKLIRYKKSFYQRALKMAAKSKTQTHVFQCDGNRERLLAFAATLNRHDIDCYWLSDDYEYGDQIFAAETSLVVPVQQPEYRFLRSLLMRKKDFEENVFYDVSSWTLPLAYGIAQTNLKKSIDVTSLQKFDPAAPVANAEMEFSDDDLGYVVDFRSDAAAILLAKLLESDISVRVAKKPFSIAAESDHVESDHVECGYGTLSVPLQIQPEKRGLIVELLAEGVRQGATVSAIRSGLNQAGPDIGSPSFAVLKKPSIAMLIGRGVSPYGAGEVWHLLDSQYQIPVTLLKSDRFSAAKLDDYTTLVLANGRLSDANLKSVNTFAEQGGTVVVLGRLAVSVAERLGKSTSATEEEVKVKVVDSPIQQPFAAASQTEALKLISGAIFRTRADLTHPLLFGVSESELAVFRDHASFLKPSTNPYANPLVYDRDRPLMAGYCSAENVAKFKGSASVVVHSAGSGRFILMADNPNFRGFWKATNRLFLNAVLLGELMDPPRVGAEESASSAGSAGSAESH